MQQASSGTAPLPAEPRDPLSMSIHLLGDMLGDVIREQSGNDAFALEEHVRALAKELRADPSPERARTLTSTIHALDVPHLRGLIKAFALYFGLVNLAENNERIRVLRERDLRDYPQPRSDSIFSAIAALRQQDVSADELRAWLENAQIMPVFTAHPTEAKRRTTLEKLRRMGEALAALNQDGTDDQTDGMPSMVQEQQQALLDSIREEVVGLWQSDDVRLIKPTVIDEVKNGLYYFGEVLLDEVPRIYRDLERALDTFYPPENEAVPWKVPPFLHFGAWMGGDRDGNPFVTPEVTIETVKLLRLQMIGAHITAIESLSHRLSQSISQVGISPQLERALAQNALLFPRTAQLLKQRNPHEPYRQQCTYIREKLLRSRTHTEQHQPAWGTALPVPPMGTFYHSGHELLADLLVMEQSLRANRGATIANGTLHDFIRRVEVFGLHTATLDIRQHRDRHTSAIAEIFERASVCANYAELEEPERIQLLSKELSNPRPLIPFALTEDAAIGDGAETEASTLR